MADDWREMSAAALGRGIGAGEIDPVALTETFLEAAEGHELGGRIYARLTPGRARAEAEAAAARATARTRRGPLDGVPVSWKDLFDSAGVATEAGSALLAGRVPEADAPVLARATAEGSVCLGKTHMSELAFSGLGLNPVTATAPCIHDPDRVAGGSSSGAAASVAFGLAPLAIGSDTAGSVRIPSVWNDLVGLKTTHGAIPTAGTVPLAPGFDTVGPLARTVEDAALALGLLGMRVPDLRGADLSGRRLAVCRTTAFDEIEEGPAEGFARGVTALEAAGAVIEDREIPEVAAAMALAGPLFGGEAWGVSREIIEAAPEKMFPPILARFRTGADVSAAEFVAAWRRLHELREAYIAATADVDAVILPTAPIGPPRIAELEGERYAERNLKALRNTRIASLLGLAALTVPSGVASAGVMFQGRPGSEAALLRLGRAAEDALT